MGRTFQITIAGESHTIWHGFDKTVADQMVTRRSMMVRRCIKVHFVVKSLCDPAADWRWWSDNLMNCDSDFLGVIYVKTRAAADTPHNDA